MAYIDTRDNRTRKNRIAFYLSDEELNLIEEKLNHTNYTNRSDFIRENLLNNIILVNDYKYLRNLVGEINKIGVNINQIARVVNTNQSIYKEHIEVLLVKLDEIWKLIDEKF